MPKSTIVGIVHYGFVKFRSHFESMRFRAIALHLDAKQRGN